MITLKMCASNKQYYFKLKKHTPKKNTFYPYDHLCIELVEDLFLVALKFHILLKGVCGR